MLIKRFISIVLALFVLINIIPTQTFANQERLPKSAEIAFIREGNLWIKTNDKERQLTKGNSVQHPIWSHDGHYLAYTKGGNDPQLWVYDVKNNRELKIYDVDIRQYEWAPQENTLAYQSGNMLMTKVMGDETQQGVISGVGNFSWMPDGHGFLVSSVADLLPTGWTQVHIYKVPMDAQMDPTKAKKLATLPKQTNDFFAIGTSAFKWSSDGKWVSFIASPTASWSMDSNTLCLLSADGKRLITADKMLLNQDWYQWAPRKNWLAYIEGEGRFAVENKHLKVFVLPLEARPSYTPKGFVDRGLTWAGENEVIVARAKEAKWDNDPKKRPLPQLYKINIASNKTTRLTQPPKKYGDFHPEYVDHTLFWVRSNRKTANLMSAHIDGTHPKLSIKNIDEPPVYYEKRDWSAVVSIK